MNPILPAIRYEPNASLPERRDALARAFEACRAGMLSFYTGIDDATWREQIHPLFSPIGWHLGHSVYVEALWLIQEGAGRPLPRPDLEFTFRVDGLPKAERYAKIPDLETVLDYARNVRTETLNYLAEASVDQEERLWRFVLQHECQHSETVAFLRQIASGKFATPTTMDTFARTPADDFVDVPAGATMIGGDGVEHTDNEGPAHRVELGDFRIARHPVTQGEYCGFIADHGYQREDLWTAAGWTKCQTGGWTGPVHWNQVTDDAPVAGVCAHEAEAYARWAGARLPTEFEWEKAAAWHPTLDRATAYPWGEEPPDPVFCNCDGWSNGSDGGTDAVGVRPAGASAYGGEEFLGNVWEWTASTFEPYPGYAVWPYSGYAEIYFDGAHRVLKGGSWATRPWALRASFRNWFLPDARQILSGFRLAQDVTD